MEAAHAVKLTKQQDSQILQWATFRLGRELYGINVMQVREVLRYVEITPVPGTPDFVLGIINLRGNVVTVIDARRRLSLETAEVNDHTRIVIVEANNQVIGILVDSVAEVVNLKQSEVESTPHIGNDENSKFFQGVYNKNAELLILLELNALISMSMANDFY